ncbi:CopG family transcriptional regulator [Ramlibacter alkalitolerans]|uniref:CopG family transcriptional regulator n=1 Tax=Ramlibacter alkalitolerans TaxID=2039631 RepID=UPI001F3F2358|nr:CopG family transcriptional regulator [Ramlibacter alkalitolerans]
MELKTARLTVLMDPGMKSAFEGTCRAMDMTPSQVVRRLIREFRDVNKRETPRRQERKSKRQ